MKLDILYLYLFSCELYCYKCNLAYLNFSVKVRAVCCLNHNCYSNFRVLRFTALHFMVTKLYNFAQKWLASSFSHYKIVLTYCLFLEAILLKQ